ncbi:MAG TPA: hypothetical protein VF503_00855 [Sphingobium sp.]|uniref:hypothetical protein n=1 Tax=Sphingobium sp. TaxID=1912891 RepID=UPI002ED2D802
MIRPLSHSVALTMAAALMTAAAPPFEVATNGAPAFADGAPHHLVAMSDDELAAAHGGFDWGGMSITFGADIRTFIDGQLALQTLVNWTASGSSTQTTVGAGLTQATLADLQSGVGGLTLSSLSGGSPVYLANGGQTALLQGSGGALQNVLINSAANLQALQQTNATINIGNYASFAASLQMGAIGGSLGREVASFSH